MIRVPVVAGLLLMVGLLPGPGAARAQEAEPEAPADPRADAPIPAQIAPSGTPSRPGEPVLPPDPPAAPPDPVRLDGAPAEAVRTPLSWPAGVAVEPNGALRIGVVGNGPDGTQSRAIEAIGRRLAELPAGRVAVEAQVSAHPRDASLARRLALARARAVKEALVAGGLPATRIDLRPLGRLDPPADLVDILPPGARSTTQTR